MTAPRHERPYTWPPPVFWNDNVEMQVSRYHDGETGDPYHVLRLDVEHVIHFGDLKEVVWFAQMILNLAREIDEKVAAGASVPIKAVS